jgi:carnitine-CoA ligase
VTSPSVSPSPATLAGVIAEQARTLDDRPFLYFEDRVVSFAALDRQVNRAANGLARLGVGRGSGVAIMLPNTPEWLFVYFATQVLGAYAVPVNVALKGDGLRHVLDHSDSTVLVVHPDSLDALAGVRAELAKLRVVVVDDTEGAPDHVQPAGAVTLSSVMDAPDTDPGVVIDPDAMCALMYTSGTTGAPKGVVNRYRGVNLEGLRALGGFLAPDDVLYTCLPLFHANALWLTTQRALVLGLPMVLSRRFSASGFWDELRGYGVTTFNALGAMIPILMKQPPRPDDREHRVRVVFSAACPVTVWQEFRDRFGVHLVEAYAAVDGGGYVTVNLGDGPPGSMGRSPTPWRIVDDDGNDVATGEAGELLFAVDDAGRRRVEYYENPEASDARIRDGWFRTGDRVRADTDGWLFFVDRKTDSLRRRGENISSWEVERALDLHPAVLESAVFGVPSELGEDDVMAAAVLREGQTITPAELVEFAAAHLAGFMVPRYVEMRDALPKTGTHRVQKRVLEREGVGPATWDREAHRAEGG